MMPALVLIDDEWVLELMNYPSSSSNEGSPSSGCSNITTTQCYESCEHDSPNSLPSLSLSSSSSDKSSSHGKKGKTLFSKKRSSASNSCKVPNSVHMVMGHGHGKLWHVIKSSCMTCFRPNSKKNSKSKRNGSQSSYASGHKRNGSAEVREEDLKQAIIYCKKSAGMLVD